MLLRCHQKSVKLNIRLLERDVRYLRRLMRLTNYHMGIQCVEDDQIAALNLTYRGVEGPTDVLAFPSLQGLEPGKSLLPGTGCPEGEEDREEREQELGDLVLGIPYIRTHCQIHREPLQETLNVMVLHGMCHLIGYDHETESQWQQMYDMELRILEQFNVNTGYKCKPLLGIGHG